MSLRFRLNAGPTIVYLNDSDYVRYLDTMHRLLISLASLVMLAAKPAHAGQAGAQVDTPYGEFVGGAMKAFITENYDRTESLLREFERRGKPFDTDEASQYGACSQEKEYAQFKGLMGVARECQQRGPTPKKYWDDVKHAQEDVIRLLLAGAQPELTNYLGCFQKNLTVIEVYCAFDHWLHGGEGLSKLLEQTRGNQELLREVEWEEKPGGVATGRWVLYPKDPKLYNWSQCDVLPRSGIVALARDRMGRIFISAYAVPCRAR